MPTKTETVDILIANEKIAGTFLSPGNTVPGIYLYMVGAAVNNAYTAILTGWVSEMVISALIENYPQFTRDR